MFCPPPEEADASSLNSHSFNPDEQRRIDASVPGVTLKTEVLDEDYEMQQPEVSQQPRTVTPTELGLEEVNKTVYF